MCADDKTPADLGDVPEDIPAKRRCIPCPLGLRLRGGCESDEYCDEVLFACIKIKAYETMGL